MHRGVFMLIKTREVDHFLLSALWVRFPAAHTDGVSLVTALNSPAVFGWLTDTQGKGMCHGSILCQSAPAQGIPQFLGALFLYVIRNSPVKMGQVQIKVSHPPTLLHCPWLHREHLPNGQAWLNCGHVFRIQFYNPFPSEPAFVPLGHELALFSCSFIESMPPFHKHGLSSLCPMFW